LNRLRWKLSLLWNKAYDDPYWLTLHPNHWRVYAEHYKKDLEEKVEAQRHLAEYIMSFHNVEAVRAVQRTRDLQRRNDDKSVSEIFAKQVESLFNKTLSGDILQEARQNGTYDEILEEEQDKEDPSDREEDILVVRKPSQPSKV
jgi:hypothetical protein